MPITIDDETLHKWARDNGYVTWGDMQAWLEEAGQRKQPTADNVIAFPNDSWEASVAALEQPDDLKPAFSTDRVRDELRALTTHYADKSLPANEGIKVGTMAATALLNSFGAQNASGLRADQFDAFMARINSKHRYATANDFIASLKV